MKPAATQVVELKATLYLIVCDPGVELAKSISPVDVFINTNPVVKNSEKVQGKTLLVVSKKEYSNNDLAQIVAKETQAEIIYSNIDNSKSLRYNNDITRKLLGFNSQISFEYQIQEYIKWKKEQS